MKSQEPIDGISKYRMKSQEPIDGICKYRMKSQEPIDGICKYRMKSQEPIDGICKYRVIELNLYYWKKRTLSEIREFKPGLHVQRKHKQKVVYTCDKHKHKVAYAGRQWIKIKILAPLF